LADKAYNVDWYGLGQFRRNGPLARPAAALRRHCGPGSTAARLDACSIRDQLPAFVLCLFAHSRSARISAVAGPVVCLAVWFTGAGLVRALGAVTALLVLIVSILPLGPLSPRVVQPLLSGVKYSALHRFYIWEFAAHRIAERPIVGWGLNSSRAIPGSDQLAPGGGILLGLHPHNGRCRSGSNSAFPPRCSSRRCFGSSSPASLSSKIASRELPSPAWQ
jgi:hypothetical protein